jgi:hypothetical protein
MWGWFEIVTPAIPISHPAMYISTVNEDRAPELQTATGHPHRPPAERQGLPRMGWREWVGFPAWGIEHLKAKVDTGARTSSLHVMDLVWFEKEGEKWVQFVVSPLQRSNEDPVVVRARVIATRDVRSSSGAVDHRPVIQVTIKVCSVLMEAELTLTNRDEMGFRMLLGRQALRGHFLVDPGASYLGGKPDKKIRRRHRGLT